MKVPFIDLKPCHDSLKAEIMKGIEGVMDRCDFVLGAPVGELEAVVAEACGCKHALGVASGTDALVIALRAAGVGPGDEVVTTPLTFIATAESVWAAGARPVFIDIDPVTYNLSPELTRRFLEDECEAGADGLKNRKTGGIVKAILPVHLYGLMADMDAFVELGRKFGLKVIEDAAQSYGTAAVSGGGKRMAGSIGDAGCMSFYPSKNLAGIGDGGMIVTNCEDIYNASKILHVHGGTKRYHCDVFGYNSRLDSIQAAALLVKIRHIDEWIGMRRRNAELYGALLREKLSAAGVEAVSSADLPADGARPEGAVVLPSEPAGLFHTFNSYEIRLPGRDAALDYFTRNGVGSGIYYPIPVHLQKVFSYLGMKAGDLPVCELVCSDVIALPQYPELTEEQIGYVAGVVAEYMKSGR